MSKDGYILGGGTIRIYALDLCRGFCALGVAAYHLSMWSGIELSKFYGSILTLFGTYGVSVFFILSGYSLAHAYERDFSFSIDSRLLKLYFCRRIGRLAPLFIAALVMSLLGKYLFSETKSVDYMEVIASVTLIFGFFNPAATPVIGGWSIGVEIVFYVFFPLLMLFRERSVSMLLVGAILTAWISNDLMQQQNLTNGWNTYVVPANHWIFFCSGAYARLHVDSWHIEQPAAIGLLVSLLLIASFCVTGATELQIVTGWRRVVLVVICILFVALVGKLVIFNGTIQSICIAMGGASYPLYLLHPLLFFATQGLVKDPTVASWLSLVCLALLFAYLVDRYFDSIVQRRIKRLGW